MSEFEMRFNSKSRSANVERAKQMVKELKNCIIHDDGQYILISGDSLTRNIIELYILVEQWKGSELYVNRKLIDDHYLLQAIINCNRVHYCKGDCVFLGRWNTVFSIVENQKLTDDAVVDEDLFNVDDHKEILTESNDSFFTVRTDFLEKDFLQYSQMYFCICPKFNSEYYIRRLKNVPKTIKIKRISYSDIAHNKEERQETEVSASMNLIINRIGDEFESRFRKIMDEYFEKKKTT